MHDSTKLTIKEAAEVIATLTPTQYEVLKLIGWKRIVLVPLPADTIGMTGDVTIIDKKTRKKHTRTVKALIAKGLAEFAQRNDSVKEDPLPVVYTDVVRKGLAQVSR